MKVQFINEGFTAGEISSDLHGRVSSDLFKESVAIMENMVSTIQGAAIRRPGSKFVAEASQQSSDTGHRLIPYKIDASRGVMFHAGPDTLTAYDQNGPVYASGVGVGEVVNQNPYAADQLNGWVSRMWYGQGVNYHYGEFYGLSVAWDPLRPSFNLKVAPSYFALWPTLSPRVGLVQAITLDPNTQYELAFTASSPSVKASPLVPEPSPGYIRICEVADATNFFPATTAYLGTILATLPYTIDAQSGSVTFVTPNWGAPTTIHMEVVLTIQGSSVSAVNGLESFLSICKLTKTGLAPGIVSFASPWIGKNIADLSFTQTPESPSKLILTHPDVAPQELIYNPVTDAWSLGAIIFVGAPWAAGDYPGTVGVHLGRLILASSRAKPERIWLSKVLDYYNFTVGTLSDDAFFGDLSEPGRILWVRSMWSLVVGAESGLWDISPFAGSALSPGNAKVFKHQAHHSSNSAPAFTNNEVAYVAEGGRRMYSVRREGDENAYVDKELTFSARHMTLGGYRDIAWAEYPHNSLWVSTPDTGLGSLMAATYDTKLLANAGWHRHGLGGPVLAVGAVSVGGIDQVFLLVSRIKGTTSYLSVERFDWSTYLDSSIVRSFPTPTTVIDGLGHLEDQEVYALAPSGVVYGPYTVTGAVITLEDNQNSVIVGIPFTSKIIAKRPEGLSQSGTSQGLKKRWNKIFVRVSPGSRPVINGRRPPERNPATPMNEGEPATYEDVEVANLGWSKEGYVTVEEYLPLPLVVAAIFGHVTAEVL